MLIPVQQGLRPCGVFAGLNALLMEIILSGCGSRAVDETAMPDGLWAAVQANASTMEIITVFYEALRSLSAEERYNLWIDVRNIPSVRTLICDCTSSIPHPPASAFDRLKKLVVHLFERTSKLKEVEAACADSLVGFYNRYSSRTAPGNGQVCGMCGTSELAQRRSGVADDKQWRSSFDHLLAESKYPLVAMQPANLLPICDHCNSKAKLAKDLLLNDQGQRRRSFDPWAEAAHLMIEMGIELQGTSPVVTIKFQPNNEVSAEKLQTWDEVFDIQRRVLGEFSSWESKISEDLDLDSLAGLRKSLSTQQSKKIVSSRSTPLSLWRGLLYSGMQAIPDNQLDQVRQLCKSIYDASLADCEATFGDLLHRQTLHALPSIC